MARLLSSAVLALGAVLSAALPAHALVRGKPVHGIALYGEPKLGPDTKSLPTANANAPKGGTLRMASTGTTFDSFNPFSIKGNAVAGIAEMGADSYFLFNEPLMTRSQEETLVSYCLLCQTVEVAPDGTWEEFTIRPEAKWHDGTPITADDVVFSFQTLIEKGAPQFRLYFGDVVKAEKKSDKKVRFTFKSGNNSELPLIMGELMVLNKAFWTKHDLGESTLDIPVGSGPYRIDKFEPGRFITYKRDPNYWGSKLYLNVGAYNFDEIRIDYFRDEDVSFEAFKARQYDVRLENTSARWATQYPKDAVDAGLMKKDEVKSASPRGAQTFAANLRRAKFADKRVRQAISMAFDFDWGNKNLSYGLFYPMDSFFKDSEMEATGKPEGEELAILEKYRGKAPYQVFGEPHKAPRTDGSGNNRDNLVKARDLLTAAGWVTKDGALVNAKTGEKFEIEFLEASQGLEKWLNPFIRNLARLGIKGTIRLVDQTQYVNRITNHDFDVMIYPVRQSDSPGNEQREYWSSGAADRKGSRNFAGIKDPALDEIIEGLVVANTRASLVAHARAVDRVLTWNEYLIPMYSLPDTWLAYWDVFGRQPYPRNGLSGTFASWWYDPAKAAKLDAARGKK